MGLRGPGAKPVKKKPARKGQRTRKAPRGHARLSRAERVIRFVESLQLTAGTWAGKPFKLRPWQIKFIRDLYAVDGQGRRPVRTGLLTVARKNGKTQLSAALALAHLCGPEAEARGEVYSAASDRDQASRIFAEMEAFILADPELRERINVQRFHKKLEVLDGPGAGSVYAALASDARGAHGLSPSFVVCDELAQWKSRELYDALQTGGGARAEPLLVIISTAASDANHIMSVLTAHGEKVNAGEVDDATFVAHIYRVPADADIFDEDVWPLANPALGDFLNVEQLRTAAEHAKHMPASEASFRNLHLNQPIDATATPFVAREIWDACGETPAPIEGQNVCFGLDLASVHDTTALVGVTDAGDVHVWAWLPADGLTEKARKDRTPWDAWARAGYLQTTPGKAVDYDHVAAFMRQLFSRCNVQAVAFDRALMAHFRPALLRAGFAETEIAKFVEFGQGFYSMAPAVRELETRLLQRKLRHGGHPVLSAAVAAARVDTDAAGSRKFNKARSTGRIDALVALTMAVGVAPIAQPKREYQVFFL